MNSRQKSCKEPAISPLTTVAGDFLWTIGFVLTRFLGGLKTGSIRMGLHLDWAYRHCLCQEQQVPLIGGMLMTKVGWFSTLQSIRDFSSCRSLFRSVVVYDPQGPLRFIATQPRVGAPVRGLGHISILWDQTQHDQVGQSICGNGNGKPCPALGFFRHAGKRFSVSGTGLAVTARGDIVGPVGGFGWILELDGGAPRNVRIENVEVLPETPLLISIAYPVGTTFTITAHAADWCWTGSKEYSCSEVFTKAGSLKQVRTGPGNQYFVDSSGVVTFRIVQLPQNYVGRPGWFIPSRTDLGQNGKGYAVERFERSGVYLPHATYGPYMTLDAVCGGSAPYCSETPKKYDPDVCPSGFQQLAYDYCCSTSNASSCVFAGGA